MSVVELLMETAVEDSKLLVKNHELGDQSEIPRDVEFLFHAKSKEQAELVASFVTDYRFGKPKVEYAENDGVISWSLSITICTPTTENVAMSLSAFMVCLSQLYDLDYDGWGCVIQRGKKP